MTRPTPHPSNALARNTNRDTEQPMPSPTLAQVRLVDELLDRAESAYTGDPDALSEVRALLT
jgi:hypothetical protein